eukprot:CAMPEP_0179279562 /NCGR_PEP_ID=MMETSP0797-20121207/36178_1 /TAXON_ID=47934 /ORGANISM="Dinophysis acuminata, Strain DAEP01" /LENGTH=222 /DNA_ID=CAMNT_0020988195 /DNA_START=68 /DNA_END=736 /DNA_ORIENTATION=-
MPDMVAREQARARVAVGHFSCGEAQEALRVDVELELPDRHGGAPVGYRAAGPLVDRRVVVGVLPHGALLVCELVLPLDVRALLLGKRLPSHGVRHERAIQALVLQPPQRVEVEVIVGVIPAILVRVEGAALVFPRDGLALAVACERRARQIIVPHELDAVVGSNPEVVSRRVTDPECGKLEIARARNVWMLAEHILDRAVQILWVALAAFGGVKVKLRCRRI